MQLTVSAKGVQGGTLNFYPGGNPAGASGQTLVYPAGSAVVSTTIEENVGRAGEFAFPNAGDGG